MDSYGIAKMRYLVICFFIAFAVFASSTEAKQAVPLCEKQIAQLNLDLTAERPICINAETEAKNVSDLNSDFKYVFAFNAHDLNFSSSEIIDLFGSDKIILVIDGMCAGKCSRLLMPLARKIVFTKGSFAALTDNSINSRGYYIRKYAGPKIKNNTINVSDAIKLKTDYSNKISGEYLADLEIMELAAKNVTHLTWHSFVRQSLVRQINRKCLPVDSLAVILTLEYYRLNSLRVKGRYVLPSDDSIIKQVNQTMPGKNIMIYSYQKEPFSGCAD
jgi:hypothetical protein